MIHLVDLAQQHAELRPEMERAIAEVFDSGAFVLGPFVERFEDAFAAHLGVKHAIGVNSGTDALVIACDLARIRHGAGEIITTPFTFFASAESIVQAGHRVRLVDIDATTFNLDPAAVHAAKGSDTVGVMPVHLYGRCADIDALRIDGTFLIEDAAQAVGASRHGRPAGGLGDVAGFSFYPTKNLGAAGDGGMMTTDDDDVAALARSLRAHGEVRREFGGVRTYLHERVGRNSRLSAIQAAVLHVKLGRLAEWQSRREANARHFTEALAGIDGLILPAPDPDGRHVYHQYVLRTPRRDALRAHLSEHGVGSNVFYPQPLHLQPAFADLGLKEGALPVAEHAAREVVSIPVHAYLSEDERDRIVAEIRSFFGA